ncbi:hypothetical protein X766_15690 [Mesorhizobium sp. LSJC255A00]|nr:hypothetical protein X766_15690 [Mesorhizobium sp. LSJC255A00]
MISQQLPSGKVGQYDPRLGRVRTHTDDFYDHRKLVLEKIQHSLLVEKRRKK